ncbi:MAG: S-layer homology domain-containing protein [Coprothermobacterota bacterium]|nr:S-layer homology domain-containing protein [Coprothermobacterota bacterium]
MRKVVFLLLIASLVLTGAYSTPIAAHNEEYTLSSDFGTTPTIDGQFNPQDEWADAHSVSFPTFYGDVTVYTKAIPNSLYLAYLIPLSVESVSFEWCALHNNGKLPQTDDRRIVANKPVIGTAGPAFLFWEGTGSGWQSATSPAGFQGDAAINPKTWIVEMAIPYDWLGIVICEAGPRGCQFDASYHEPDGAEFFHYWPPRGEDTRAFAFTNPDSWGNMEPSDCWGSQRGRLLISKGPNSPPDHANDPADQYNEMMQLVLKADLEQSADVIPEDVYLNDLAIMANGTGNDQTDIANVMLVEDPNQNGIYDPGETLLAQSVYPADDGTITFTFAGNGYLVPLKDPKVLLVVYVMNPTLSTGSTYQFMVAHVGATGASSGIAVPVVGFREQLPAATAVAWRYLLWSAIKTVPGSSGKPSMTIQKLATYDTVAAGENITFNILVSNSGDTTLYFVKVTDLLPPSTSFVEAPATASGPAGSYDPGSNTVTWDLGNLAPGDWKQLSLVIKVAADAPDGTLIRNRAVANSTRPKLEVQSDDEVVVVGGKIHEAYIKGYAGDLGPIFGPQRNVTRGEIAAIIARLLQLESTVTGQQFYSDVPSTHWTFKYVEAVHRAGIMTGFPDGTFRPDQPATRANVAVAMIRARGIDPVAWLPATPFPDISGHWAIREIETAYVLGIVEGLPDGTFNPDAPIIRAETVTLIDRALGRGPLLEGPVVQHFPDCQPTDWFYGWGEESFASHRGVHMGTGNERLIQYVDTGPVW